MVSQKSIITILFLYRSRSSFENLALWQSYHISYGLVISAREIAFYEAKSKLPKSRLTDIDVTPRLRRNFIQVSFVIIYKNCPICTLSDSISIVFLFLICNKRIWHCKR